MPALRLLCRPTHRLGPVLAVVSLVSLGPLLARASWTPRTPAVEQLTMEVCSSSGVHRRAPMAHKSVNDDHDTCCHGAWLGLPLPVPVAAAIPLPRQAASTRAAQPVALTTSARVQPPRDPQGSR
jgi:hypothetical protein